MKVITLNLTNDQMARAKKDRAFLSTFPSLITITEINENSATIDLEFGKDGSRVIIMNNEDEIVCARYSCVAAFQLDKELGINLEEIL